MEARLCETMKVKVLVPAGVRSLIGIMQEEEPLDDEDVSNLEAQWDSSELSLTPDASVGSSTGA